MILPVFHSRISSIMDIDGGLPYEADDSGPYVPPVLPPPEAEATEDVDMLLDRPLDDMIPDQRQRGSGERRPREPIPDHVQNLMGRMGKGKVYLAEESPGIIHHDAERRIARDPVSQYGSGAGLQWSRLHMHTAEY